MILQTDPMKRVLLCLAAIAAFAAAGLVQATAPAPAAPASVAASR